jgi:glycolate oxidase FAD binding subunit
MATAVAPQTESVTPSDRAGVAETVRAAYEANQAVYPVGGGTALDYGTSPTASGTQLNLTGIHRIVDYTPRDMTILIEAGMRMADLEATLAKENQHLPIDVPRAADATVGGVVATNWNGSRRYGHGTVRDYVIGIHAVDGRGVAFQGGGRVVKNVAGYDFCKLLTGSLGTLAVITQLALKVKPKPEATAAVIATCDIATAETILARLANLPAPPVAIDLLAGPVWQTELAVNDSTPKPSDGTVYIAVRTEGTEPEAAWLAEQAQYESWTGGALAVRRLNLAEADALWKRQIEFGDRGIGETADNSPLVVKICIPPSAVTRIISEVLQFDPNSAIQAHAANGIILARFSKFGHADLTAVLAGKLRPAAAGLGGSLIVVSTTLDGITPHLIWGGRTDAGILLERVKQKFDPRSILNPGRFVY